LVLEILAQYLADVAVRFVGGRRFFIGKPTPIEYSAIETSLDKH
jgi:hypothetical protein